MAESGALITNARMYSVAPGAIAAWKRLPLGIANVLGPPIVRGLG